MAKNDAADFARQLDREFEIHVTGHAKEVTQKIGLEALSRIVLRTPVDTGRARGSWDVTLGAPTVEIREAPDPSGGSAIAAGAGVITGMQDLTAIWIQSNLAYIGALENGHSQQAPAGMVAVTIAELETAYSRVE